MTNLNEKILARRAIERFHDQKASDLLVNTRARSYVEKFPDSNPVADLSKLRTQVVNEQIKALRTEHAVAREKLVAKHAERARAAIEGDKERMAALSQEAKKTLNVRHPLDLVKNEITRAAIRDAQKDSPDLFAKLDDQAIAEQALKIIAEKHPELFGSDLPAPPGTPDIGQPAGQNGKTARSDDDWITDQLVAAGVRSPTADVMRDARACVMAHGRGVAFGAIRRNVQSKAILTRAPQALAAEIIGAKAPTTGELRRALADAGVFIDEGDESKQLARAESFARDFLDPTKFESLFNGTDIATRKRRLASFVELRLGHVKKYLAR